MNTYEAGDTILFQGSQYLVMKVVEMDSKRYLILASNKESFELLVCLEKQDENKIFLELVDDENLRKKVLFEQA